MKKVKTLASALSLELIATDFVRTANARTPPETPAGHKVPRMEKEYTFAKKPLGLTINDVDNKVIVTKVKNQACLRQGIVDGSQILSVDGLQWDVTDPRAFTWRQYIKTAQLPIKMSFKCPLTGKSPKQNRAGAKKSPKSPKKNRAGGKKSPKSPEKNRAGGKKSPNLPQALKKARDNVEATYKKVQSLKKKVETVKKTAIQNVNKAKREVSKEIKKFDTKKEKVDAVKEKLDSNEIFYADSQIPYECDDLSDDWESE